MPFLLLVIFASVVRSLFIEPSIKVVTSTRVLSQTKTTSSGHAYATKTSFIRAYPRRNLFSLFTTSDDTIVRELGGYERLLSRKFPGSNQVSNS